MVNFTVYGKPVPKGRPRFTTRNGFGVAYTPKKTHDAEKEVARCAVLAGVKRIQKGCPVSVKLKFYMPIPKSFTKKKAEAARCGELKFTQKPDIDNLAKIIDGLNGIAWEDDSQIVKLEVEKCYGDIPRTEICIEKDANNVESCS